MNDLAAQIAQLSPEQRAKLTSLLRRPAARADREAASAPPAGITPVRRAGDALYEQTPALPLSFTQERIWFLEQFSPGTPFRNMSGVARIPVPVDPAIFTDCIDEVVTRHEVLRTRFVMRDGEPIGIADRKVTVPVLVLGELPAAERERLFKLDATRPFDLRELPLLRVTIAPDGGDTLVQLTMHHIVSDGFSTGVFFAELGELYRLRLAGMRAGLVPLPFQFADVAAWERQRADSEQYSRSLRYWSEHLRGAPQRLTLPADHPRPARMTERGNRLPLSLPSDVAEQVALLSQRYGVTPFVVALAAFIVTLSRCAAQDDLIVGVPVANREQRGVERLIGPFLNTLALRFDLSAAPTFAELSRQVNQTFLAGLDHQEIPFDRVLQQVQDTRDPGRSPLFQVVFNFQVDQSAAGTPGSQLQDLHNGGCAFDLLVNIVSGPGGLTGHIDYYADVYDEESVRRIADAFLAVLRAAARDDVPVTELPLVPVQDWPDVTAQAAGAAMGYDKNRLMHELVLAQADSDPSRTALIEGDRTVSYGDLRDRASGVAAKLLALVPASAGAHVAICLPRSADMIISILGVLKAGLSYVPLDPDYPPDRLGYICQDADIVAVVTRGDLGDVLGPVCVPVIDLDQVDPGAASAAEGGLASAGQCAYTIYTSGSTGRPKGVQVSHRNVVNFLISMRERPGLLSEDVVLAVTSPSFDIAVLEMFLPLVVGARTVIASPAEVADGHRLAELLGRHDVTVMQATPATWQLMLETGWPGRPGLRALCGGEAFPPALADALVARCQQVWNMYGPTETTIWSTIHQVTLGDLSGIGVPIGRPIANTTAFVLDAGLNPVPTGVLGELCLGGDGVAIGYYKRQDLTDSKFIEPQFLPGQRLYRTGDLVRARADGNLEFAGRNDHQVKLRGFRIELGEIEAVLGSHPLVARAAAVATADAAVGKSIVAYAEPSSASAADGGLSGQDLQAFVAKRLPEYMVPARVIVLTKLPLTPNGKIDRNNLPRPDRFAQADTDQAAQASDFVAPRTETEQAIAAIWQDLLGLPEVGVQESFFELGGHSLLATKLIFRLREVLGADLPLNALFEGDPTIERLAILVTDGAAGLAADDQDLDLAAEARLAEDIRPAELAHVHSVRHPQHVLLTGATGFVGAFLLAELLKKTEATIFCLVRAASEAEGQERIRDAMAEYGIWEPAHRDRIVPVLGTLSQPRLGLSRPQWQHLAAMTGGIYHCGAEVNFLQKYHALKPANVLGTEEILRLACEGTVKPVHFVSTIYVYSRFSYPPGTEFMEDMEPIHDLNYTFGYTQSKWVSEQMVIEAGRRGLPVFIYRLGRVAGHSTTGACQTYDFVWQVTKVGIEMAAAPIMDMTLDVTPVDYVAAALIHLSRQPEMRGKAFHLLSPKQITEPEFVSWLERYGYHGERTTFAEWCERVVRRAADLSDRTAGALAPFLSGTLPLDRMPAAHFDQSNVQLGLAGSDISCRPMTEDLLRTYLDYFTESGYLPPPPEPALAGVPGLAASANATPAVGKDSR